MPLSWNEIKDRALRFSREWKGEGSERAEAQSFWNGFFDVFGIDRRRVAIFEKQVEITRAGRKLRRGRIDAFWKGVLLIEHKSAGEDLERAFAQASDYFEGLPERDLPRYILVSDFARFRLYDLEADSTIEFRLGELHQKVRHFGFIAGYRTQEIEPQNPVNIRAAEQMGKLHDLLKASGYTGHPLELLLVRVLFCLFADDTGIFQPAGSFRLWLDERTARDGSDLGPQLAQLFQVLNQREGARPRTLDEQLRTFPYVNGRLFEEMLPLASFDTAMRETLLDCCALDWSAISPAIFGALFQSIMDEKARRNLGAHYTSEENIQKLIKPLFLDDLWDEFGRVKGSRNRLFEFHKKLRTLIFLDPACGCGNFLVISYRELRRLELEILRAAYEHEFERGRATLPLHQLFSIDVDQFYGIEIEEFPAQIAQAALWLVDHQMNMRVSEEFGAYFARIPLVSTPHIVHGNALRLEWNDVLPAERCSYVMGNPPFVGHQHRTPLQVDDMHLVWGIEGRFGRLDYVSAWYWRAVTYMHRSKSIRAAFVSTNSVCQGEQVGILWGALLGQGVNIHFAHRPFVWSNEGRGQAAVHCVIIGFGLLDGARKVLFDYEHPSAQPQALTVTHINPYLVDAPDVLLPSRSKSPGGFPVMTKGSQPTDGGNLILSSAEREELLNIAPRATAHIRRYVGADELLYGYDRWCLWLKDAEPAALRQSPAILERVAAVREFRKRSSTQSVRELANSPTLFTQDRQPSTWYLAIPAHTSETRRFIPMTFLPPDVIASNALRICADARLFHFGVLQSTMHNAWVRYTAGRLESRYRYEPAIYNNFPWPENLTAAHRTAIEAAAQGVLDARAAHPKASLADLYDPLTMPPNLIKAHQVLDAAVDAAFGRKGFRNDAERVAFLFELYQKYTRLLPAAAPARKSRKRTGSATA